jgi:hypothetical protein
MTTYAITKFSSENRAASINNETKFSLVSARINGLTYSSAGRLSAGVFCFSRDNQACIANRHISGIHFQVFSNSCAK